MTTTFTKLTGQDLLDYVHSHSTSTHTENCKAAGYLKELKDGQEGCDYIAYFEAILDARKANGEYESPKESGGDWYESLTEQDSELYDKIEDMCPEFTKLTGEQCQEFMDELSEYGITTAEQFDCAYYYQTDSWDAEKLFAEWITTDVNCVDLPDYVVIDWQATWDSALCYDFFYIEFDGETYFFNNNF